MKNILQKLSQGIAPLIKGLVCTVLVLVPAVVYPQSVYFGAQEIYIGNEVSVPVELQSAGSVTIGSGGALQFSGNDYTNLSGATYSGPGYVVFSAPLTGTQSLSGANIFFQNLRISNGNNVLLAGSDAGVTDTLDLLDGSLQLGSLNLGMGGNGMITGAAANRYVVTNGAGALRFNSAAAGKTLFFPVGSTAGTDYTPAQVKNGTTQQTVNLRIQRIPGAGQTPDTVKGVRRVWNLWTSNGGGLDELTLYHNDSLNGSQYTSSQASVNRYISPSWKTGPCPFSVETFSGGLWALPAHSSLLTNTATNAAGDAYYSKSADMVLPAITPGTIAAVCQGATSASLPYTGAAGGVNQYGITWNTAAQGAGFTDVTTTTLPASPISFPVPAGAAPNTYTGTLTVRNSSTNCEQTYTINVTINAKPAITPGTIAAVCQGATSASLPYTGATGGANQYGITWNTAAQGAGFTNVTTTTLPASPISFPVPAGAAPNTYTGTLTVRNSSTGCEQTYTINITINANPGITPGTIAAVCQGATSASLPYTGATGGANQYGITWNTAAQGAGFTDVTTTTLPASPISFPVPAGAAPNTYTGTLTVRNSSTSCEQTYTINVTINAKPAITPGTIAAICQGATSASLPYTGATGGANQYGITWNTAAQGAGFTNVTTTTLPASPISFPVPAGAAPNTYTGTLTVRNSSTGCEQTYTINVTINAKPAITPGTIAAVCQGATSASLPYTGATGGANQYGITWNTAAQGAGFTNVTTTTLPASPISFPVPAGAAPNTYTGTLTVRNSSTGCEQTYTINVTINAKPAITPGTIAAVCQGATSASLPYTGATGGANQYGITWNTAAQGAGFANVTTTTLPASPISFPVPAGAAPNTYTGTLTVRNSSTSCEQTYTINVTINANPAITPGTIAAVCQGATSASLPYTGATGGVNQYGITWNTAAQGAGFTNVTTTTLPASPISFPVPAGAAPNTYTGTLTVRNSSTSCEQTYTINVTINAKPGITPGTIAPVCQSATSASLPYTGATGGANQYGITWNTAAQGAGFTNVTTTTLPASPVSFPVPAGAAPNTYTGTLTVRNSSTSCEQTYTINVQVLSSPSLTPGTIADVCAGSTSASLPYSSPAGGADQYRIAWDVTATGAGFTNVSNTTLPASPVSVPVSGTASPGTYNGTLTVRNSSTGCEKSYPISVGITVLPTITLGSTPEICAGADSVFLPYTGTTDAPDRYNINWGTTAATAGFINVNSAPLALAPGLIRIGVPAGASANTYSGTLTVGNAACGSIATGFDILVHPVPTAVITPAGPVNICYQDSVVLTTGPLLSGHTYLWRNGSVTVGGNTADYTADTTGSYTVIMDNGDCADTSAAVSVTWYPRPDVTVTPGDTAFCEGGKVILEVPSGMQQDYQWKKDAVPVTGAQAFFYEADVTGIYTVVVSRSNVPNCTDSSAPVSVTVHPLPQPTVSWDGATLRTDSVYAGYKWYINGQLVPGATSFIYIPVLDGRYTVTVTDSNGCTGTSSSVLADRVGVDITQAAAAAVRIYPNPSKGMVFVDAPVPVAVSVNSIDGKALIRVRNTKQVDITDLPGGIYMVYVTDEQGALLKVEKVTKN